MFLCVDSNDFFIHLSFFKDSHEFSLRILSLQTPNSSISELHDHYRAYMLLPQNISSILLILTFAEGGGNFAV